MAKTYTLDDIREMTERITADDYEIDWEESGELEDALVSLMEDRYISANGLRAGLQILELNWKDALTAAELTSWWEDHYRKVWSSKAAFAEDDTRSLHAESGQVQLFEYLDGHIDWAGLADSYSYSDYTFVEIDDEFHAFMD